MKTFLAFSLLFAALSFCGLAERFSNSTQSGLPKNANTATLTNSNSTTTTSSTTSSDAPSEKPAPTAAQTAIMQAGKPISWDEQGITWNLPSGWKKISQGKTLFNYGANGAFLIVNISNMAEDFPSEISLKATYDGQVSRKKNGELELVRYLEIDSAKGVEFIEAMPEKTGDPRRHQWIAFRKYAGQKQMITLIANTTGANFEKNRDTLAAILYSMKLVN